MSTYLDAQISILNPLADLPSSFRYTVRRFFKSIGEPSKPYTRHLSTVCWWWKGKYYIRVEPKEASTTMDRELEEFATFFKIHGVPEYIARATAFISFALRSKPLIQLDKDGKQVVSYRARSFRSRLLHLRASFLESETVIKFLPRPVNAKLTQIPRIPDPSCQPVVPPEMVAETYKEYALKYNDDKPLQSFMQSRVTGTTVDGICNSLQNLLKNTMFSSQNPRRLFKVLYLCHALKGWKPTYEYPIPSFDRDSLRKMKMPSERASGLIMRKRYSEKFGDVTLKFAASGQKEDLKEAAIDDVVKLFEKLEKMVKEGRTIDVNFLQSEMNTIWAKVEALEPGKRKEKNRIFFIVNIVNYIILKYFFRGPINSTKGSGNMKTGVNWHGGDMQRIFTELGDCIHFLNYDIRGFDYSHMAPVVAMIMGFYFYYYNRSHLNPLYKILAALLAYIINELTVREIQWPDETWRVIIGKLLSGLAVTADFNADRHSTIGVDFIVDVGRRNKGVKIILMDGTETTVDKVCRETLKLWLLAAQADTHEQALKYFKQSKIRFVGLGDNGIIGVTDPALIPFFAMSVFHAYVRSIGYDLNFEECYECSQFDNKIDLQTGELLTRPWTDPTGKLHENKPWGIEFLKIWPVKVVCEDGTVVRMPFKPTSKFFFKLGKTGGDISNPLLVLVRCHGHMATTYGNGIAYEFIKRWKDLFLELWERKGVKLDLFDYKQYTGSFLKEYKRLCEDYSARGHFGVGEIDLKFEPSFSKYFYRILDASKANINKLSFYNESASQMRHFGMHTAYFV